MIQLTTLGGFRLEKDGAEIPLPAQARARTALLVFLVAERDVWREKVASVFWPDYDEEKARHNLSQALYQLRQWLGDEWLLGTDRLRTASSVQIDTEAFEAAVKANQFDAALELYRGPFLAGVDLPDTVPFDNWVEMQRAHFERLHRTARRRSIDARVNRRDYAGAIAAAREWIELSPAEDEAQHRLIELLAADGQTVEAIRQYEVYERILAADGLTPLEDTKALVAKIRGRALTAARPRAIVPQIVSGVTAPDDLEIIRPLGEGSVARVLLAREPALKRLVAVKILRSELAKEDLARLRFEREAQAAASVAHPNITGIHRIGRLADGVPYIVMEYIDGRTLEDLLAANGVFTSAATRRILAAVADALSAAHQKGVVHRDVRTGNIMLENGTGRVVLMDFGFAALLESGSVEVPQLTRIGERIGDPLRMSPEQRAGERATPETDVYAIGVLGCELLTAKPPSVAQRIVLDNPASDEQLRRIIRRCLAERSRHRPAPATVATELRNVSAQPAGPPRADPVTEFVRELQKRKVFRLMLAYAAGAFVVLQGAQLLLPAMPIDNLETWYRGIAAVTLAGFPLAIIVSWFFDWSTEGLQRTRGTQLYGARLLLSVVGLVFSAALAFGVWVLLMS